MSFKLLDEEYFNIQIEFVDELVETFEFHGMKVQCRG